MLTCARAYLYIGARASARLAENRKIFSVECVVSTSLLLGRPTPHGRTMPLSHFPPEIQRLYWMERFPLGGVPSPCSGFDAERGKLINAFSTHRARGRIRVEVIRYWPAPRMWVRERIKRGPYCAQDSGWRRGKPRRGVNFCHDPGPKTREDSRAEHALRIHHTNLAISRIPTEVRRQVCRFSRRHHWALLNLFWAEPRFCERASTQPILTPEADPLRRLPNGCRRANQGA